MIVDLGTYMGYFTSPQQAQEMYAALRKKAIDTGTATKETLPEKVLINVKPIERATTTAPVITLAPKTKSQEKIAQAIQSTYTKALEKAQKEGKISNLQAKKQAPVIKVAPVKKEKAVTFQELPSDRPGGGAKTNAPGASVAVFPTVEKKKSPVKIDTVLKEAAKIALPQTVTQQLDSGQSVVAAVPATVITSTVSPVTEEVKEEKGIDFAKAAIIGGLIALPFLFGG